MAIQPQLFVAVTWWDGGFDILENACLPSLLLELAAYLNAGREDYEVGVPAEHYKKARATALRELARENSPRDAFEAVSKHLVAIPGFRKRRCKSTHRSCD